MEADIASSDLAVGPNRFTFGILDGNHPVSTGRPKVYFFYLKGFNAVFSRITTATFNNFYAGLPHTPENSAAAQIKGVYVTHTTFDRPGKWGAQIVLPYRGKSESMQAIFYVNKKSTTPSVGSSAPRSHNPTTAQEPVTKLDSGRPPDDMHSVSIADAIARHRPLVVLFATAAYCTSRLCGPEIEVVQSLERKYRPAVDFVHIEVYKDARPPQLAPTFLQWGLRSEPWVFVVNRRGVVTAKFEGPTTAGEIEPAINRAMG
jgi:hypothetical protein